MIFKDNRLKIVVKMKIQVVNFLNVAFNKPEETQKPYKEKEDKPI